MLAIVFPNATAGLDGIRLRTTRDKISALIYEAKLRADRVNRPIVFVLAPEEGHIEAVEFGSDWTRDIDLHPAVGIKRPEEEDSFTLLPGVPAPAYQILLSIESGDQAGLEINPFLGVANDWVPGEDEK